MKSAVLLVSVISIFISLSAAAASWSRSYDCGRAERTGEFAKLVIAPRSIELKIGITEYRVIGPALLDENQNSFYPVQYNSYGSRYPFEGSLYLSSAVLTGKPGAVRLVTGGGLAETITQNFYCK